MTQNQIYFKSFILYNPLRKVNITMKNMHSILIADDEKYVRNDIIQSIHWPDYGFYVIGEAENGRQALELVQKLQPDVLITDIKMPFANGLKLIENAYQIKPDIQCVIISGYEDFHYAQEAIRLNVSSYLTKPIDENSILAMLQKLSLKNKDFSSSSLQCHNILTDSVSSFSETDKQKKSVYAIAAFFFPHFFSQKESKYMLDLFHSWLTRALDDTLTFSDIQTELFSYGSNILRLRLKASCLSAADLKKMLSKIIHLSVQKTREFPVITVTAPFQEEDKLDTFSISCLQFLNIHLLFRETLIWYRILPPASQTFTEKIMKDIEAFRTAISDRHFTDAENLLSCLICNDYLSDYTAEILEYIVCEVSNTLRRLSLRYQLDTERSIFQDMISSYYLMQFFNLEELKTDILKRCKCIFSFLLKVDNTDIVAMIKAYVQQNYENDITLVGIATEFFFNPSYLSRMFKMKTGGNLSAYIEEVRIQKALNLFQSRKLSIAEAARMVGYNDPNYFSKIFKKRTGFSPSFYAAQEGDQNAFK